VYNWHGAASADTLPVCLGLPVSVALALAAAPCQLYTGNGRSCFTDRMIIMIYTSFNTVTARPGQFKFDKRERPRPRIY
jgi:hypothetical protein